MKIFTLFLLFIAVGVNGQTKFETSTWTEVLAKARAENKIVFLDAYASWCGPCKWMDKNVFPTPEASAFFNSNFVNAKFDMEKGEGIDIAKKYEVVAFPTYLFVDGDGQLLHKLVGSQPTEPFLKSAKKALDPEKQYTSVLKKIDSETDPATLYEMAYTLLEGDNPAAADKASDVYLASQKDWLTPENLKLINEFTTSANQKKFQFMATHPKEFKAMIGEDYDSKITWLANEGAWENVKVTKETKKDQALKYIQGAKEYFKKLMPTEEPKLTSAFAVKVYSKMNDQDVYVKHVVAHYKRFPTQSWNELNSVAWNFFKNVDDPLLLKEGIKIGLESLRLNQNYHNLDTVANLYAKAKEKEKARVYALKAIALGKADGQDVSGMEKLLE